MEKNVAALMREDTYTIRVMFDTKMDVQPDEEGKPQARPFKYAPLTKEAAKSYTYIADLPLQEGELVVVEASNELKLATVVQVDEGVDIEPNSNIYYRWVIAKVDLDHHEQSMAKNRLITEAVSAAYKTNLRRSFAQNILLGMPEEQRLVLEQLTKGAKT